MKRNNLQQCKSLRKNQTDAETKLWGILRNRQLAGVKFRRQFPFNNYILDFYSPEYMLAIEVDGGQHYEEDKMRRDAFRTQEIAARFSNLEVLSNIEGVYEVIENTLLERRPPHLNPLPSGERKY